MDHALPSYARVNLQPAIDEILILDELETTEERGLSGDEARRRLAEMQAVRKRLCENDGHMHATERIVSFPFYEPGEMFPLNDVAVLRDGRQETVRPYEVVPGDVVELREGCRAPGDCRVLKVMTERATQNTAMIGMSVDDEELVIGPDISRRNCIFEGCF